MVGSVPAFTTQFCFCSALEIYYPNPVGLFRVGLKTQVFTSFLLLALERVFFIPSKEDMQTGRYSKNANCGQRELYNPIKGAL
jgi:hypothetical protein